MPFKNVRKVTRTRTVEKSECRQRFNTLCGAILTGTKQAIFVSDAGVLYDDTERQYGVITELLKPVIRKNKEGENLPKEDREEPVTWSAMKQRLNTYLGYYDAGSFTGNDAVIELNGKDVRGLMIEAGVNAKVPK